jgi:hypothetical protein
MPDEANPCRQRPCWASVACAPARPADHGAQKRRHEGRQRVQRQNSTQPLDEISLIVPQSSLHRATVKSTRNHALWSHFRPYRYVSVCGKLGVESAVPAPCLEGPFFHLWVLCALARGPRRVLRYPACSGAWRPIRLVVTRTEANRPRSRWPWQKRQRSVGSVRRAAR